jgi:hypothetical protein
MDHIVRIEAPTKVSQEGPGRQESARPVQGVKCGDRASELDCMAGLDIKDTATVNVRRDDVDIVSASRERALILANHLTRAAVTRSQPADDVQNPH